MAAIPATRRPPCRLGRPDDAQHSRSSRSDRRARDNLAQDRMVSFRPCSARLGLIETVGSVGAVINNLKVGRRTANATFDSLREGLAAPHQRHGHLVRVACSPRRLDRAGLSRPQMSQAQNRFHTELSEEWIRQTVHDLSGVR